jgi:hypothetical protein
MPDPIGRLYRLIAIALAISGAVRASGAGMWRRPMKVARAKGRPRGKQPKLSARQEARLVALRAPGG